MPEVRSVLYTGAFRFPDQDAAAFRVLSVAELFKSSGCAVVFAGWERPPNGVKRYVYSGYDCFSQDEFRGGVVNPIKRLFSFLFRGHKTAKWIWKNRESFGAIVAYNPTVFFSLMLLLMARLVPFKIILDSTEWYESDHLPGGPFGLASLENWLRMNLLYKLFNNVICISSFLENYFIDKSPVRIPPLLSNENFITPSRPDIRSGINLIYAGEAGKKDRLTTLIASLPKIQEEIQTRINLHIVGMSKDELSVLLGEGDVRQDYLSASVVCYGRVTREEVLEVYGFCHFSILFRDYKRYAYAGFPTKAMESLASGCPIITNAVGDLSKILANGVNAFILEESQLVQQLPTLFNQVLSDKSYESMANSARSVAINHFSPNAYKKKFAAFVDACFDGNFRA
jgi:glycosyltransferase involved in cell wall biosynthesis